MSKQQTITSEQQLRDAVRDLWAKDTAFDWRWKEWEPRRDRGIDAIGELVLDGRRVTFLVECKLNPGARDVEALSEERGRRPLLLIAPNISDTLLDLCREKEISCADLNGRVWLRAKGLVVDRQPSQKGRFRAALTPPDPFSLKSSRLARSLLNRPDYLWSQKELVERTGLSKGLVSRLAQHLEDEGLIRQEQRTLRVERWGPLLDAWAARDDWRKRTTVQQYSLLEAEAEEVARRLSRVFSSNERPVFTQWFAANLRRAYTIPPAVSAYVPRFLEGKEESELRARQVPDGGSLWLVVPRDRGVFLETQRVGEFTLACDAQIYLDLLEAGLRGPEQAQVLREWEGFGKQPP